MAFVTRKIDVTLTLGAGDFGDAGKSDSVKLTGLKVSAQIVKPGLPSTDNATIRIWGVTKAILDAFSQLGKPLTWQRNNTVMVEAGDDQSGMSQVFMGTVQTSYADFSDMPNACLTITAQGCGVDAAKPVKPISFPNGADVVVAMQQIAATMSPPKNVQNFGVSVHMPRIYYAGTALDQLKALANDANINMDPNGLTVDIWPKDGSRTGDGASLPLISPDSGLIGYPSYSDYGISLRALYQPGIIYGGDFELKTSIKNANGRWSNIGLSYDLESETPDGHWFMNINAYRPTGPLGKTS